MQRAMALVTQAITIQPTSMPETWSPCSVARRIPLRVRALICCSLRSRSWRCKAASRLSALRLGAGSGAASASAYLSRSSRLATGLRSAVRRAMGTHQSGYSSPAHRTFTSNCLPRRLAVRSTSITLSTTFSSPASGSRCMGSSSKGSDHEISRNRSICGGPAPTSTEMRA